MRIVTPIIVLLVMTASAYAQCDTSWTAISGSWSNPLNWSSNPIFPNSKSTSVCLTDGTAGTPATTQLNVGVSIDNLEVGSSNTLNFNSFTTLSVYGASIMNSGAINLASAGQATQLLLNTSTTISGGGSVNLSGSSAAQILGSNLTLLNVDNAIQGQGTLGAGGATMLFQNALNGVVNANVTGQTMTVTLGMTPGTGGVVNAGTLEATNGGTLSLYNTIVNNKGVTLGGGLIGALSGSVVQLAGSTTIQGGTLFGSIQTGSFGSFAPTLDGITQGALTNGGTITTPDDSGFEIALGSVINNTGAIILAGRGSLTGISLGTFSGIGPFTTTLTGGGMVTMTGGGFTSISGGGGVVLENVNNTIQGTGTIAGAMTLNNDASGLVLANVSTAGLVLTNTGGMTNTGTLEAANGGTLQVNNAVNNTAGLITTDGIGSSATVQLQSGAVIRGGTLNGNVETAGNPTLDGFTDGILTNAGSFTVQDSTAAGIALSSTINNTGTITVASKGFETYLYMGNKLGPGSETAQFTGNGVVTLSSPAGTVSAVIYGDGGVTLENVNNTIQGQGLIGIGHNMILQNDAAGVVDANSVQIQNGVATGQSLILNGTGAGINVINDGTLEATNGGILQIGNTVNNQNGTVLTDNGNGSEILLLQNSDILGGKLNGNVLTVGNQAATLDGTPTYGMLTNTGTVTVVNGSSLTLAIGGTINNTGTISLTSTGGPTQLLLGNASGTTTLTGSGVVTMSDSAHNNAASIYGNSAILENLNNTIQGEGVLGGFDTTQVFQNDAAGIIDANTTGRNLIIDGLVNNTGRVEATLGGVLQISSTINNNGGTISTDIIPGSVVQLLSGSDVQGGTLNGNVASLAGNTGTLDGIAHGPLTNLATVTVVDASQLNLAIGSIIMNKGAIALTSTGDATQIYLGNASGTTTLTGGGTVTMSNTAHNGDALIFGGGGATLENTNNTIQGEGQLGVITNIIVKNDTGGTIDANVPGQALVLNGTGGVINAGMLEANSDGIMQIHNTVNNTGSISTDSGLGSVVQLFNGADIQGGALNGNVETVAANTTAILDGTSNGPLTNSGMITLENSSTLSVVPGSTVMNAGLIAMTSTGNDTWLYLGSGIATTKLTGGGTVTLSDSAHNNTAMIFGDNGVTLENVNNTIQGEGVLGGGASHNIIIQNDLGGTLNANVSGRNLILNGAGGVINTGILEATGGGVLQIANTVTNTLGIISTDIVPGSEVQLFNGADIQGGLLAGNVQTVVGNTNLILDGTITRGPLTNAAIVAVVNDSTLTLASGSTLINEGAMALMGQGSNTWLYLGSGASTTTLTGGGTVTMSNSLHNGNTLIYGDGGVTLENVNNTIQGEGEIGDDHVMKLMNDTGGTLLANFSGQTLLINGSGTFTNKGTMQVNPGSTLRVEAPAILSSNTFSAGTLVAGNYIVNSGKLEIDGLGNAAAGEIATIGASASVTLNGTNASTSFVDLGGNAALKPLTQVSGGLTIAGGYSFATVGSLTNSGSVTVGTGSTLTTGSTTYTQSAGSTTVAGTLNTGNFSMGAGNTTIQSGGNFNATGTYTQSSGNSVVNVGGTLSASQVAINGGLLQVDGTLDPVGLNVTGGKLGGIGAITANLTNNGHVSPGDASGTPGTLTLVGNYTQGTSGYLDVGLGNSNQSLFSVSGAVNLNGTLDISCFGSCTFSAGTEIPFLSATGGISGTFSTIVAAGFTGTNDFSLVTSSSGLDIFLNNSVTAAVPEPDSEAMMLAGLGLVGWAARRRNAALRRSERAQRFR
jgi:fibronectin-binding autotransporter adhesin